MWKNYFKIALRNVCRQPGYVGVNTTGLAVGIACCLILVLFVRSELAVNDIFPAAERIYRIDTEWTGDDQGLPFLTAGPVGTALERQFPAVTSRVRMYGIWVTLGTDRTFYRRNGFLADPSFFEVFDLPLLSGNADTALEQPRSVVLRADLAQALFGTVDATGRTVEVNTFQHGPQTYTVTGVWKTLPKNSVTQFDGTAYKMILSETGTWDFAPEASWQNWENRFLLQYVRLESTGDIAGLRKKLGRFTERNVPEPLRGNLKLALNPLTGLYLSDHDNRGWTRIGLLSALAGLILLIAGMNFTNLSTARSLDRTREIGVRKTLGAYRGQLTRQFLAEAVLMSLLATVVGLGLAAVALNYFSTLVGTEFVLQQPWDLTTISCLVGLAVIVGLLAGAYPAFILSRFQPTTIFNDRLSLGWSVGAVRKGLVVAQFALAIVLLIGVYVVHEQVTFATHRDLGFPSDRILVIDSAPRNFSDSGYRRIQTVREELASLPVVESASVSWEVPIVGTGAGGISLRRPQWPKTRQVETGRYRVDSHYSKTYNLQLMEGRFFRPPASEESTNVVINETAVRALGLERAVGSTVELEDGTRKTVIGVVKNFNRQNVRAGAHPLIMTALQPGGWFRSISVKLAPNASGAVGRVEAIWNELLPDTPFEYSFLDQKIRSAYDSERQMRRMVGAGGGLALFLALLGIGGLTGITVRRRTKEIAVRKVCGASVGRVIGMLSSDVARLVAVAFAVGGPVGYLLARQWLENFASRVQLTPYPFVAIGLAVLALAFAAVSFHTIRAARTDPAVTLTTE